MPAQRILIPFHDFSAGGTELIAFRLAKAWIKAGRTVSFLIGANNGPMRDRVPDGVSVTILSPECPRSTFSRVRLGKHMAADTVALAPDAIFIPGNFHFGVAHAMKHALPNVKIIAKISNPLIGPPFDHGLGVRLARPVLHGITRGIDWFAAMSQGLTQEAQRQLGHDRVATLYDPNIPDDVTFDFERRQPLAPNRTIHLIGVGRLEPQKNWPLAFQTVAEIRKKRPTRLTIYGEGWQRAELQKKIVQMGLQDCISLAGFTDDLARRMNDAHLMLISSNYEGGPAVAVEALAQGLPFVSTDCSHFLREITIDQAFGTLVKDADPASLANAVIDQLSRSGPQPSVVAKALTPVRITDAANAYLHLFDHQIDASSPDAPASAARR